MQAIKVTQLIQILKSRKGLVAAVAGIVVVATLIANLLMPKTYIAEVSLIVDSRGVDPVTGTPGPTQLLSSYLATQVDVIASHNVALKVVDKLKLGANQDSIRQFQQDYPAGGSIRDWLADRLLKQLNVKPARESSVVDIDYSAQQPRAAADLANAFADAYMQTSLELKVDPARRQASWFQEQVRGLRTALEAAQQRLSDYQRKKGIAGADDRLDVENTRLEQISSQLVAAQGTSGDAQSRLRQTNQATEKQQLEQLPDILGNSLLQSMKADLVRAEAKLGEISQRYDRNHPQYLSAAAEVAALKSKLAAELQTATGSIRQGAEIAQQRVAELQRALDQQKTHILQLKQQHDDVDVLSRDVENAQHTYDSAIQRAGAVQLEGQLDQSNIAILNPAIAPLEASEPRLTRNLLLAVLLGGLLGVGAALAVELIDRRIQTADELVASADLAVLGEIPGLLNFAPRTS